MRYILAPVKKSASKTKFLIFLSFAVSLWTSVPVFGLTARSCLERNLPAFIEALESVLSEPEQDAFLDGWTKTECYRLIDAWRFIDFRMAKTQSRSPEALFQSHGGTMLGVLGELYGIAFLRNQYDYESGERVMDEVDYKTLNPSGRLPDGLAFRIEDGRLTVLRVLESKLGGENYDQSQGLSYLERWKSRGLVVPWKASAWHFSPELITLGEIPLPQANIQDLRNSTLLVGSRERTFDGGTLLTPVQTTSLREVILQFLNYQLKNVPIKPEPKPRTKPAVTANISHRTPRLTDAEVPDFRKGLVDFLYERQHWPKGGSECALERYLAHKVSSMGGQSTAFIRCLTGAERHFLTEIGQVPASGSLAATLLRTSPYSPGAISALRAHLRSFDKELPVPGIILQLRQVPAWSSFLDTHPFEVFRTRLRQEETRCQQEIISRRLLEARHEPRQRQEDSRSVSQPKS